MRAYHLLPAEFALSDVALQRLKISRLNDLNDPFELQALNLGNRKDVRRALAGWKSDLSEMHGLLCFSKNWHNPVLWSHYAARHKGICLGFDLEDGLSKDVKYASERLIKEIVHDTIDLAVDESLVQDLLYTKFEHWKYEEETRVFVELDSKTIESGCYFYPFGDQLRLREVILGPLCEIPIAQVRALVKNLYKTPVYVMKARLAFKWFKVVEDERFREKGLRLPS